MKRAAWSVNCQPVFFVASHGQRDSEARCGGNKAGFRAAFRDDRVALVRTSAKRSATVELALARWVSTWFSRRPLSSH